VSPLCMDMFWKQSSREGVAERLAGRRRGCMSMSKYVGAAETELILDGRRVSVGDVSVQSVGNASDAES
jgi:hypothetical protein